MSKHVKQKITFRNVKPKTLFELYMNVKKHALISGAPVIIGSKEGSPFSAHDGYITGKALHTVKDRIIMQSWRGKDWAPEDPDSVFTIILEQNGKDTILHAIHIGIPDSKAKGIEKGWHEYYWKPWKQYLAGKKIKRASM